MHKICQIVGGGLFNYKSINYKSILGGSFPLGRNADSTVVTQVLLFAHCTVHSIYFFCVVYHCVCTMQVVVAVWAVVAIWAVVVLLLLVVLLLVAGVSGPERPLVDCWDTCLETEGEEASEDRES